MRYTSLAIALSLGLLATPAVASERDATSAERQKVVQHLTGLGYSGISDIDVVNGRFEVDARSPRGRDVDVILNMRTLKIISVNAS